MAIDISVLDDKSKAELLEALTKSSRMKVDYTNMTDAQRRRLNANIEPIENALWTEYPKWQYGDPNGDGQIIGTLCDDEDQLKELHAKYPDARWKDLLRDHGIETCPSKPMSTSGKAFLPMGAAPAPVTVPVMSVDELTHGEKIAAGKAKAKAARAPAA